MLRVLVIGVVLGLGGACAQAPEPAPRTSFDGTLEWTPYLDRARRHVEAEELVEVEGIVLEVLPSVVARPTDRNLLNLSSLLQMALLLASDRGGPERQVESLLRFEGVVGPQDRELRVAWLLRSVRARLLAKYDELGGADEIGRGAHAAAVREFGPDHYVSTHALAVWVRLVAVRDPERALRILETHGSVSRGDWGDEGYESIHPLLALGYCTSLEGRSEEVIAILEEALARSEAARPWSIQVARIRLDLGAAFLRMDDLEESFEHIDLGREILEAHFEDGSQDLVRAHSLLSSNAYRSGDLSLALSHAQTAGELARTFFGSRDRTTLRARLRQVDLLWALEDRDTALRLLDEARRTIQTSALLETSLETQLGTVEVYVGRELLGLPRLERAVSRLSPHGSQLGKAAAYHRLAWALALARSPDRALPLARRAVSISEASGHADRASHGAKLHALGLALVVAGRAEDGRKRLDQGFELVESRLGPESALLDSMRKERARVLRVGPPNASGGPQQIGPRP